MLRRAAFLLALLASAPAFAQFGPAVYVPAAASGGGYTGPGDLKVYAAWGGLRAFSAATVGTRAASICNPTPTCQDINTLANGQLDEATITSALGCNNSTTICNVQLYDKTGNSRDFINLTAGQRPTLLRNCINSTLSCYVYTTAASTKLATSASLTQAAPVSAYAVADQTGTPGAAVMVGDDGFGTQLLFSNVAFAGIFCGSTTTSQAETDNAFHVFQAVCASGTNATLISIDGSTTTATQTPAGLSGHIVMGNGINAKMVEGGIVFGTLSGADLTALNSNAHTFWGF